MINFIKNRGLSMSLVNCINLIKHLHLSSYDMFRNALLKFIKPIERKIFKIHDHGIKILNKTEISHLHEHKFRHAFKGFLNPLCSCSIEAETTTHYFLGCHLCKANRANIMNDFSNIPISFSTASDNYLTRF